MGENFTIQLDTTQDSKSAPSSTVTSPDSVQARKQLFESIARTRDDSEWNTTSKEDSAEEYNADGERIYKPRVRPDPIKAPIFVSVLLLLHIMPKKVVLEASYASLIDLTSMSS